MKYEIKDTSCGYSLVYKSYNYQRLIEIGDILIFKSNWKRKSFTSQNENHFDYHSISNAFHCQDDINDNHFIPKRICEVLNI